MTTGERMAVEARLTAQYPVELIKKGRGHFYRVIEDGKEYILPGVTGILSMIGGEKTQKLIGWAKKEALNCVSKELMAYGSVPVILEPDIINGIIERAKKRPGEALEAAADYGTRLHAYADQVIKGEPVDPAADLENSVLAFQDWFKSSGLEVVLGDTAVASVDHGYGGKFDAVAVKDGRFVIIDFKTSNGIREDYALQTAAYGRAFLETYGVKADLGLVVRFDKTTPTFETKWVKDMNTSLDGFLAAKTLKEIVGGELYV